jgi:hypothetical protein
VCWFSLSLSFILCKHYRLNSVSNYLHYSTNNSIQTTLFLWKTILYFKTFTFEMLDFSICKSLECDFVLRVSITIPFCKRFVNQSLVHGSNVLQAKGHDMVRVILGSSVKKSVFGASMGFIKTCLYPARIGNQETEGLAPLMCHPPTCLCFEMNMDL